MPASLSVSYHAAIPYRFGSTEGISSSALVRAFSVPDPPETRIDGTKTQKVNAKPGQIWETVVLPLYTVYRLTFEKPNNHAWIWIPTGVCALGYVL
ncbi:MAG: hypothetical protein IMW86_05905 [Hydrogenibacillus sp.]|nr:hypothetical protein [Hydrogenibacillus sp.]